MHISGSDVILLAHAACGFAGCTAALWVFVDALNVRPANVSRIQIAAVSMAAAWICGGYWYVHFYPPKRH